MLLINLCVYWILWCMFLVIYHTANMQCSIFLRKLPLPTFKKLTRLLLFEIKTFLTVHNRFFTKISLPHFGRWDVNVMTLPNQLDPKQITNLQNATTWLQNSAKLLSKDLSKRLQTWGLRKQESIKKISNWVETDASAQSPF